MGNQITKQLIIVTPDHLVHNVSVPEHIIQRCNYFRGKKNIDERYVCTKRLDVTRRDVTDFVYAMQSTLMYDDDNVDKLKVYLIAKELEADITSFLRIKCLMSNDQKLMESVDEDQIHLCRAVDTVIRNHDYSNLLLSRDFKDCELLMMYLSVSDTINPYSDRNLSLIQDLSSFQDLDVVKLARKFVSFKPNVLIETSYGNINLKEMWYTDIVPGKLNFLESLNEVELILIATDVTPC